jgi:hypothetical protein
MRSQSRWLVTALAPAALYGQLTPEQRVQDFQNLAALYAKRYAPYEWKKQAVGFDVMDIAGWLGRIRGAKDDLEFYEIQAEYVASLQDTHSSFQTPGGFSARLGFTTDIYDGKVLIDGITRSSLPESKYPFQVGDELVSLDGKTAEEWIAYISRFRRWGNPMATRRYAAGLIVTRSQSVVPRTGELGDYATVVIQRQTGETETYTIPWIKSGTPLLTVGPVPTPKAASRKTKAAGEEPLYLQVLKASRNWSLPPGDPYLEVYALGLGQRDPILRPGLPADFVPRLGRASSEFHFSGTYQADGLRIGYLRIPNFGPNMAIAIRELDAEIDYFQKNTDGLVVDVMRNTGGGC